MNRRQNTAAASSHSRYVEQIGAESREEKTFRYYGDDNEDNDDDGEVLLAAGYHNTLTVQEPYHNGIEEPAYDYTIGNKIV